MELIADRFILGDNETALDLATAERVALTIAPAGSEQEQRRWALSCDVAQRWHQPGIARLLDYGIAGDSRRFEARQILSGTAALRADPQAPAIVVIPRPAVAAIGEVFEHPHGIRPRSMTLWGPDGAGKGTIVGHLARAARLRGFVPVAAPLLGAYAEILRGRSLLVIDVGDGRAGWPAWLAASIGVPRPHVLLFVAREEPATAHAVAVGPVSIDALVRAVRREAVGVPSAAAIRRFAERSHGWPGSLCAACVRPASVHRLSYDVASHAMDRLRPPTHDRIAAGRRAAVGVRRRRSAHGGRDDAGGEAGDAE